MVASLDAQVIAIDGKGVNGIYDREHGVRALQMVSAWASAHRLVLAQCSVATKSNEITAIPRLLQQLTLTGSIVTIDAMGAQLRPWALKPRLRDRFANKVPTTSWASRAIRGQG